MLRGDDLLDIANIKLIPQDIFNQFLYFYGRWVDSIRDALKVHDQLHKVRTCPIWIISQ